jgi:hypothetical protein
MNTASTKGSTSSLKGWFLIFLIVFFSSLCALAIVTNLDRRIERTSGKVIDTYSKTVASKRKSYDQEYLVISYTVSGKEYTGKTIRRTSGGDFVPVFYYHAFPGMAWFYKKANPNQVYCCVFIVLSLIGVLVARPRSKKAPVIATGKAPQKKK